jgi:hypothetical protein
MNRIRTLSVGNDRVEEKEGNGHPFEQPILVYHESARSIVFRDQLRRAVKKLSSDQISEREEDGGDGNAIHMTSHSSTLGNEIVPIPETDPVSDTVITTFQPKIVPLPALELGPTDDFAPLLNSQFVEDDTSAALTDAEKEVCRLLRDQRCTVKTIKNEDWSSFLQRFMVANPRTHRAPAEHDDIPPDPAHHYPFNSFVTSTSLLPTNGLRMRCYGSTNQYTVGVVFALPSYDHCTTKESAAEEEDADTKRTQTWSWPSGYSAKTEFNIDGRGRLINGRYEALLPLSTLREYNNDYVYKDEYIVGNRKVRGLSQILYNEVYLRVGGVSRCVPESSEVATTTTLPPRSYGRGCGIPVALFVRSPTFGHLISLMRTRSRIMHIFGMEHVKGIPLLFFHPDLGVRVLTESLQGELWKIAASNLTPFQNSSIAHKTTMEHTDEQSFQQKVGELIELDDTIRQKLTPEELGRLAGGFGATDDSVATVLQQVMMEDQERNRTFKKQTSHRLQDVVNEGLAAAVRSGDYHTSRQLLILYSLVASQADVMEGDASSLDGPADGVSDTDHSDNDSIGSSPRRLQKKTSVGMVRDANLSTTDLELFKKAKDGTLSKNLPLPPPPPPLDTDRLRSATNSDGLLAVLGAAQVLKAMQDGGAKKRAQEVVSSVEEWVNYGEQSMAFRISSWYDQRAAQGDLKIATENDSSLLAFVSNKAISNRKSFAQQIRAAVENTDFNDVRFLSAMDEILSKMHSPCLRLELLQYVLGLDNRYSVAHVRRSVELAASCLSIVASTTTAPVSDS